MPLVGLVHSGVNGALVKALGQDAKELGEAAEEANKTVPDVTIHKIRKRGSQLRRPNDQTGVELVDPHFPFEETEHAWLRMLQGIDAFFDLAVDEPASPNADGHERKGKEKYRLNQPRGIENRPFAGQIVMQPRPRRREHDTEDNRAECEHDQRQRHDRRAFVRVFSRRPRAVPKKT